MCCDLSDEGPSLVSPLRADETLAGVAFKRHSLGIGLVRGWWLRADSYVQTQPIRTDGLQPFEQLKIGEIDSEEESWAKILGRTSA